MSGLRVALKEWAVVCDALATGDQSILLRKGGIAEPTDGFRAEHQRFWLYPTYLHQNPDALIPSARARLSVMETSQPRAGLVRMTHFAEMLQTVRIDDEGILQHFQSLQILTEATIRQRFYYRQAGLNLMVLKVYRIPHRIEFVETPEYLGCKSWVQLNQDYDDLLATPVLEPERLQETLATIRTFLPL